MQLQNPISISSKITNFSKIALILLGLPISAVVAVETQYSWWGVLIGLGLAAFCIYIARITVNSQMEGETFLFKGLFQPQVQIPLSAVQSIQMFRSKKHTYFLISSRAHRYFVISPLWGSGREHLLRIYQEFQIKVKRSAQ